jgi:sugar/nucleoside kinase (ribokinase family)
MPISFSETRLRQPHSHQATSSKSQVHKSYLDIKEVALKIAEMTKVSARPRMVVITQGADPTIVAYKGEISTFPVIAIAGKDIVDTTGTWS